jgi:predicted metal-dependent peptidase
MAKKQSKKNKKPSNADNVEKAEEALQQHPLFYYLSTLASPQLSDRLSQGCWAQIDDSEQASAWRYHSNTLILLNKNKRLKASEWQYILALAYLHLGLNHLLVDEKHRSREWQMACELYILNFAKQISVGRRPLDFMLPAIDGLPMRDEETLMQHLQQLEDFSSYLGYGIGGSQSSWLLGISKKRDEEVEKERSEAFAKGLNKAVQEAIKAASDTDSSRANRYDVSDKLKRANKWVINSFPLLSALASSFTLIEDKDLCERMDIDVAAIHPQLQEVYFNPRWNFSQQELIFILLHEYLHVGLRHDVREQGRNAYYWNVACDYVINGWLIEMHVGEIPAIGMLYDPELKGRSAEDIYDEIARNVRWQRKLDKLQTPRGNGKPDIINDKPPSWWCKGEGMTLDDFYRRSLKEGLAYAQTRGRGLFPAGLIEEIKAINQRPIPWDVQLTAWLDQFFPPIEHRRSYSRLSRRQSSTPDIPRPSWIAPEELAQTRTFGVILDTSGSMTRRELAMALGAISAYAGSRDVPYVRLVYCDATPYDAGYIEAESLLERIEIKGRGGTVLQPAVNLLQRADDFPQQGPLLIITDGGIDHLRIKMEHAYLLPRGLRLPYRTKSPVFYFEE